MEHRSPVFDLMKLQQIGYNLWNTDHLYLICFDETTTNCLQYMEHISPVSNLF
jgi:hypothetical protein